MPRANRAGSGYATTQVEDAHGRLPTQCTLALRVAHARSLLRLRPVLCCTSRGSSGLMAAAVAFLAGKLASARSVLNLFSCVARLCAGRARCCGTAGVAVAAETSPKRLPPPSAFCQIDHAQAPPAWNVERMTERDLLYSGGTHLTREVTVPCVQLRPCSSLACFPYALG